MIRVSRILKDYQEAGSLESLVNICAAIGDRTFVTYSGHLITVLQADAPDYECLDPEQRDHVARRFEGAIRGLDEHYRIHQYLLKSPHVDFPVQTYTDPVLQQAVSSRTAYLRQRAGSLYRLEIYLAIVYTGWQPTEAWNGKRGPWRSRLQEFIRAFSSDATGRALDQELARATRTLADRVDSLVVQLRDVLPLAVLERQQAFRFLRRLLNPSPAKAEAGRLTSSQFIGFQAADSALECHRDHLRLDNYTVKVLSLKEPPAHTFAHLWRELYEIPATFVVASEWMREDNARVRRLIQSKRRHFHTAQTSVLSYLTATSASSTKDVLVDNSAVGMVEDLGGCLEELELTGRHFGQFSLTVVLYGLDPSAVQRAVAECLKVFAAHDARVIEERYNLFNAWLSVLPGNDAYSLRRLWLMDRNFADLSFLFGQRTGEPVNAHLNAEHLVALETESATPYFLNLHYQDVAHSIVLGATGSGKSFLLNVLLAHFQKYDPFTFVFDLGGGYDTLTQLFQGAYASIGSEKGRFSINPFCLPLTLENRPFLASFCRVLIESGGYAMTADDEKDLSSQIECIYHVVRDQRRLLTLANIVNRNLRRHLQKWVEGGTHARWFDNVTDNVTFARFQTFDFEGMADYPEILEPLVFYLLHRANAAIHDSALTGVFKVFILDEAWCFFRHPAVKLYIVEALKTWRKLNAAMVLATQSVDDLRQSELLPAVAESCATKLFLSNPGMDRAAYRDIFHLNETEAARIAGLIPKKQLLIKRPDLAKVLNLNVDAKSYWLYTNNAADNQKRREAFERYGLEKGLEILARSNS